MFVDFEILIDFGGVIIVFLFFICVDLEIGFGFEIVLEFLLVFLVFSFFLLVEFGENEF